MVLQSDTRASDNPVPQVGDGPLDDDEMRRLMGTGAGGWNEFFDRDPSLMDLYRSCSCCAQPDGSTQVHALPD